MNYHVIPNNDARPHEQTTTCECGPKVEHIAGNMVIIHNSFDGREGIEWAAEIINSNP